MSPLVTNTPFSEVRFNKFLPGEMRNNTYHLRRTKFVVYQLCTTTLIAMSALSNTVADKYTDRRKSVLKQNPTLEIDVDNIAAMKILMTAIGVVIGMPFGTAMLWDLWWPERRESRGMSWGWKVSALIASLAQLAATLAVTIVVASGAVGIKGPDEKIVEEQLAAWPDARYRDNGNAIGTVVLAWMCLVTTVASTGVMWSSYALVSKFGPFANCRRDRTQRATSGQRENMVESSRSGDA